VKQGHGNIAAYLMAQADLKNLTGGQHLFPGLMFSRSNQLKADTLEDRPELPISGRRHLVFEKCSDTGRGRVGVDSQNVWSVSGAVRTLAEPVEVGHVLFGVVQSHFDEVVKRRIRRIALCREVEFGAERHVDSLRRFDDCGEFPLGRLQNNRHFVPPIFDRISIAHPCTHGKSREVLEDTGGRGRHVPRGAGAQLGVQKVPDSTWDVAKSEALLPCPTAAPCFELAHSAISRTSATRRSGVSPFHELRTSLSQPPDRLGKRSGGQGHSHGPEETMKSATLPSFWDMYHKLDRNLKAGARKAYQCPVGASGPTLYRPHRLGDTPSPFERSALPVPRFPRLLHRGRPSSSAIRWAKLPAAGPPKASGR